MDRVHNFLGNLSKLIQPEYTVDVFEKTHKILDDLGYKTENLMKELMHPCNLLLYKCSWLGKFVPCDTLFRTAKSIEGYCCSFNYDAIKDNLEMYFPQLCKSITFKTNSITVTVTKYLKNFKILIFV